MTVVATVTAVTAASAVAIVGVVWPLVSWRSVATLEKPKFVVLKTLGDRRFVAMSCVHVITIYYVRCSYS